MRAVASSGEGGRYRSYGNICFWFGVGFPKEDLFGHLQDGFGGDYEERVGEECGRQWRGGERFGLRRAARRRGLCDGEAIHAAAVVSTEQGLEPQHRAAAVLQ